MEKKCLSNGMVFGPMITTFLKNNQKWIKYILYYVIQVGLFKKEEE